MSIHITAGAFRGRALKVNPKADFRPTTGYGRQMLFNILGGLVDGSAFLDLYAGSGAVGFEALSRGAAQVVFVEENPGNADAIEANVETLELEERCRILCADASHPEQLGLDDERFDIAFLDPPYALFPVNGLAGLGALLKPGGVMIYEHSSRKAPEAPAGFNPVDCRKGGDSAYSFYRKIGLGKEFLP